MANEGDGTGDGKATGDEVAQELATLKRIAFGY